MSESSMLIACNEKITRAELTNVPTPPATGTHVPIPTLQSWKVWSIRSVDVTSPSLTRNMPSRKMEWKCLV